MKKNYSLVFAMLYVLTACTNESEQIVNNPTNEIFAASQSSPHYVSYEQALSNAINFMSSDSAFTRSAASYKVASHYEYLANKSTRGTLADTTEVRFYVINFVDNGGFALVAADERTVPVYAYSYEGNLDIDDAISNTGFGEFMESAIDNYKRDIEGGGSRRFRAPDTDPEYRKWITKLPKQYYKGKEYYVDEYFSTVASKSPMLTTAWNQCDPYNYYSPSYIGGATEYNNHAATGCGPLAIAQICAYHEYPDKYLSSTGISTFPWSSIKSKSSYAVGDYSNNILRASYLISQIQAYTSTLYDINNGLASVYMDAVAYAFDCLNYSRSSVYSGYYGVPGDPLQSSLDNNRPVFASGFRLVGNSGHAWVIDGYRYDQKKATYYETTYPYNTAYTVDYLQYKPYYHCNWGWGGEYNAYTMMFSPDGTISDRYIIDNQFIYDIHPND